MNQDKYIQADNDPLQASVFVAAQAQVQDNTRKLQRRINAWADHQETIGDELKELTLIMAHLKALPFGLERLKLWLTYQLKRHQVKQHITDDLKRVERLQIEAEKLGNARWSRIFKDWYKMEQRHLKKL